MFWESSRSRVFLYNVESLLSCLRSTESAYRAYLFSRKQVYLQDFRRYEKRVQLCLAALVEQNLPTKELSCESELLQSQVSLRLKVMRTGLALIAAGREEAALQQFNSDDGMQIMHEIESTVAQIRSSRENYFSKTFLDDSRSLSETALLMNRALMLISGLVLILLLYVLIKDLNWRKDAVFDMHNLFESNAVGQQTLSTDGKITGINRTMLSWLGWTKQDLIGKPFANLLANGQAESFLTDLAAMQGQESGQDMELDLIRKDGSLLPVTLSTKFLKDRDGNFLLTQATVTNASEKRSLGIQLEAKVKELEKANEEMFRLAREAHAARDQAILASQYKSQFIANVSHEIRTPMNCILGMGEILRKSPLEARQRHYLDMILESGQSLLAVINDILDFSKIEAGKLCLEFVQFEPVRLVESVAEILTGAARDKTVTIMTYIDSSVPKLLYGDENRIRQILVNLAGNAVKFTERGEVLILAEREESDTLRIKFSVRDSGIGIAEEKLRDLFEPFVQIDGAATRLHGGTGLGLSISKHLVELMQGQIGVESEPGSGSTFWFTVPLAVANSLIKSETQDTKSHELLPQLQGLRVLVVDDQPFSREVIQNYLLDLGLHCTQASSGIEALRVLRESAADDPYSLLVLDLVMPQMDGFELAGLIKQDPLISQCKMIMMTGFSSIESINQAKENGFSAYLNKPVRQSDLFSCICAAIDGKQVISAADTRSELLLTNISGKSLTNCRGRVLLVEDHPVNQEVARIMLESLGCEVHIAGNGQEALTAIEKARFALVFMDVQMPVLNGIEAVKILRHNEAGSGFHLPVVAMTAHAMEGSREECISAGMDDFISKPVSAKALLSVLDRYLPDRAEHSEQDLAVPLTVEPELFLQLKERVGSTDSLLSVLNLMKRRLPVDLLALQDSFMERDISKLASLSHTLHGAFASLGIVNLQEFCSDLEAAVQNSNWELIGILIEKLRLEIEVQLGLADQEIAELDRQRV